MIDEDAMGVHDVAEESVLDLANLRTGPGIVVLSVAMRLLYMNQTAQERIRQLNATGQSTDRSSAAKGVLPKTLMELCGEVIAALKVRTEAKDWEQFHVTRIAGTADRAVLLRAFGVPDSGALERARIVVTIEPLGRRGHPWRERAKEQYHLTGRELAVLEQLVQGLTNKEIANALTITEQTVKEHIKHIMRKTGATTRTGILAKVLQG